MELIDGTLPTNAFIDFCRYMVGILGVTLFVFGVVRFLQRADFWPTLAFTGAGVLTAFQQIEALGEPFIPWRLPMLALVNVAGLIYLYRINPATYTGRRLSD